MGGKRLWKKIIIILVIAEMLILETIKKIIKILETIVENLAETIKLVNNKERNEQNSFLFFKNTVVKWIFYFGYKLEDI